MAIFENYITGDDFYATIASATAWFGQSFTPVIAHTVESVELLIYRNGSPGTVTVSIKATDGNGHPTGDDLCSGTTDGDTLTTSTDGEWREITLGSGYALTADTKYAIVVRALSAISSNFVRWRYDITDPTYSGGNYLISTNSGTSWTTWSGVDFMFKEKGPAVISSSASLGLSPSSSRALALARSSSPSMSLVAYPSTEINLGAYLCIASRTDGSIKTSSSLGASWTNCAKDAAGGLQSAYFAQYLNRLCAIGYENVGFHYSSVNDITANWTAKTNFPNLPSKFTDMFVGRDAGDDPALYFLTPVGMYYLDVFTNFVFGPTEVTWEYDVNSGKCGFYGRGGHYIAVGKGIYNVWQGDVKLIGPDRDDGLPEDLQGTITDMIQVGFWLVIAIDGGASNKSSIMKRYLTGNHWHPVYVGSANTPIRALCWDSGTLYFGEGTNVKSLPFPNTTDNVKKLSTHTYAASGSITYPRFHSPFESMPKVAHKVRAVTEDCNTSDYVTISYRVDEDTDWTELGSFKSSPRPTALPFPASGDSVGVDFENIQLKAAYTRGSTTTNSPKLVSLILEYRVVPPVLWGFDCRVIAKTHGDTSGQDVIDALKTDIETSTLLSFYPSGDKSKTEYFVQVIGMPGNEGGTEFGTEGIYTLSLGEVVE